MHLSSFKLRKYPVAIASLGLILSFLLPHQTNAQNFIPPPIAGISNTVGICYGPAKGQLAAVGEMTQLQCLSKGEGYKWTEKGANPPVANSENSSWWVTSVLQPFVGWLVQAVLTVVSLVTGIAGVMLNGVVYLTIVRMADGYREIGGIDEAWRVIRDIANMSFIFMLLYAAIQTILGIGKDTKGLIVRIVVVAILINFSLFFTRVVIDISNLIALTFYERIAPGALNAAGTFSMAQKGLSDAFMQNLNVSSLYNTSSLTGLNIGTIITSGVMGSVILLITAFSFFAVALLLLIRYVVLIIVLILSPIAFISYVLPKMDKYRSQWSDALINQAFFAPIYFALTLVTLHIMKGVTTASSTIIGGSGNGNIAGITNLKMQGTAIGGLEAIFATIINFAIVIALIIISLVVAKDWAGKTPYGVGKLTKWAMGAAGGATIGVAAWAGRNSIGRIADNKANDQDLKDRASAGSLRAKLQLAAARKTSGSSFDLRATKMGGGVLGMADAGKAGGKGGFADYKKKKAEEEEKYAKSLGPSDELLQYAKEDVEIAQKIDLSAPGFHEERLREQDRSRRAVESLTIRRRAEKDPVKIAELDKKIAEERKTHESTLTGEAFKAKIIADAKSRQDRLKGINNEESNRRKSEVENRKKEAIKNMEESKKKKEAEDKVKKIKEDMEASKLDEFKAIKKEELKKAEAELIKATTAEEARKKEIEEEHKKESDSINEMEGLGSANKKAYANSIEKSWLAKARGYNKAAAAKIRKGEKPIRDQIKELLDKEDAKGKDKDKDKEEKPKDDDKSEGDGEKKEGE